LAVRALLGHHSQVGDPGGLPPNSAHRPTSSVFQATGVLSENIVPQRRPVSRLQAFSKVEALLSARERELPKLKAAHAVQPKTLGADKGLDCGEFFQELERRQIEPHVPW
jgi:hypothetical protein